MHTYSKCLLTGLDITPENDSRAHLVPSALGGRLKPTGLLCREANDTLNAKVDLPLVRALHPLVALLGVSRDRGEVQPTKVVAESGQAYALKFGEPLTPVAPDFSVREVNAGRLLTIRARDLKQLSEFLPKVKTEVPELDLHAAVQKASMQYSYLSEDVKGHFSMGPDPIFPATFVMASILSAYLGHEVHPQLRTYVAELPPRTRPSDDGIRIPMPPDTFFWAPPVRPVDAPDGVTHILAYVGDPLRKEALVYVELLNLPGVAVKLPYAGTHPVVAAHGVDVLQGTEVPIGVMWEAFDCAWEATHAREDFLELVKPSLSRLFATAKSRMREFELGRIAREVFGDSETVDPDRIDEFARRVTEWLVLTRQIRARG